MAEDEIEELFKNACSYVRTTPGTLKSDDLLYFYARYKQVEEDFSEIVYLFGNPAVYGYKFITFFVIYLQL